MFSVCRQLKMEMGDVKMELSNSGDNVGHVDVAATSTNMSKDNDCDFPHPKIHGLQVYEGKFNDRVVPELYAASRTLQISTSM